MLNYWVYSAGDCSSTYITHDPKDTTKITKWVESNFSEPPVIYDEEITRETVQSMTYYLQSKGYFQARGCTSELQPKEYTVNVIYNLFPGERFYVDSIQLDSKRYHIAGQG